MKIICARIGEESLGFRNKSDLEGHLKAYPDAERIVSHEADDSGEISYTVQLKNGDLVFIPTQVTTIMFSTVGETDPALT